jgi:Fe-S-cluster containining protein
MSTKAKQRKLAKRKNREKNLRKQNPKVKRSEKPVFISENKFGSSVISVVSKGVELNQGMISKKKQKRNPNKKLPCNECGGACCGILTPWDPHEIEMIKRVTPNFEKLYNVLPSNDISSIITKKNITKTANELRNSKITYPCVFLGKDGLCSIYENRPKICRDYGIKTTCAYEEENSELNKILLKAMVSEWKRVGYAKIS